MHHLPEGTWAMCIKRAKMYIYLKKMSNQENEAHLATAVSKYHFGKYQNTQRKKDSLENGYFKVGARKWTRRAWNILLWQIAGKWSKTSRVISKGHRNQMEEDPTNHTWNNLSINESTTEIDLNILNMLHIHTPLNSVITMAEC